MIRQRGKSTQVMVYAGRDRLTGRKRWVSRQVAGTGRAAHKEAKQIEAQLLAGVAAGRHQADRARPLPGRGRPRRRPAKLVGDKGYSFPRARRLLRRRGIAAVIPTKSDQRRRPSFDRAAYRGRNRVERSVERLKQFRRVATRYDKRACNYLAWVTLATAVIWL